MTDVIEQTSVPSVISEIKEGPVGPRGPAGPPGTLEAHENVDLEGNLTLSLVSDDGLTAPELHFASKNGLRPDGKVWGVGIDVAATAPSLPSQDFVIFKMLEEGVNDLIYISHGGEDHQPQVGIGWLQPFMRAGMKARLNVCVPLDESGDADEPEVAAIIARGAPGQTAPIFGAKVKDSAAMLWGVEIDGSVTQKSAANITRNEYDGSSGAQVWWGANTASEMVGVGVSGETRSRAVLAPSNLAFGGGSTTPDCVIRRQGAGQLFTDETSITARRTSAASAALATRVAPGTGDDTNDRLRIRADGLMFFGTGSAMDSMYFGRTTTNVLRVNGGKLTADNGLGVGNSAAATTLGSVVKKTQVFDAVGTSLGYVPIYDNIT